MKRTELAEARNEELLATYARAAETHGTASESGDHRRANREYDVLAAVCQELRRRGLEAQKGLLALLEHKPAYVRMWAASHCLEFASSEAEVVLEDIAKSGGVVGFSAEMTLREWRRGALKFP